MAGNEWINSYLEAILDAGSRTSTTHQNSSSDLLEPEAEGTIGGGGPSNWYSPTKYFVEEVVNRFDDADLHKTWIKVVATRNSEERNNRLENMCWRIWHLTRKKKQIEWEDARQLSRSQLDREQGRKDASEDLSELSEGEKEKSFVDSPRASLLRINSDTKIWSEVSEDVKSKKLYIVLISLHGLVRGDNMELGRDSDTGGQVKYVVELARALASTAGVYRVDLLTRQIASPDVDWTYGEPVEMLTRTTDSSDGCGAYIIRIPCGPRDRYIPKESLWPHIPEFVDRALSHITNVALSLADQLSDNKPVWPYVVHGHYADAAEVAARLCGALNVPMVMTGHSLGRSKLEQLLKLGRLSRGEISGTYRIERRIEAEEAALDAAEMVVTSTRQEIEEQWGLYDGFDVRLERKLRVRMRRGVSCLGRYMPRMVVIPPGMDFSYVSAQDLAEGEGDLKSLIGFDRTQGKSAKGDLPPIWSEIMRFFTNPHKPMILALSRPDPKKNVATLLKAFGECQPLRKLANMTLILGNRDDIEDMSGSSAVVLATVLKLIDRYDLYGKVAYPKHHKQSDIPQIYRLAAKTKGVFINPALVEPFGLTLIEAAAYGLPVVATKNGGPVDIIKALNNGLLIDPHDHNMISDALLKLVADKSKWLECRRNGLKNIHRFSWPEHCKNYLSHVDHCRMRHPTSRLDAAPRLEEPMSDSLRDVDDLSIRFSVDATDVKANGDVPAMVEVLRRHHMNNVSESTPGYGPGRRQRVFVIATDCYNADGQWAVDSLAGIIEKVRAIGGDGHGKIGYVFSTGSSIAETLDAMMVCGVDVGEFDALICSSGGEVYFPWRDLVADGDYDGHVQYRWPAENVKLALLRLAAEGGGEEEGLVVDEEAGSSHCYAYSLKAGVKARKIDAIRRRLRMRGFRCNLVYTRASTRLNVVPLFATRALALRFLSVRWGIDLAKMVVFVGETGDTDHEDLLPGLHKTLILGGLVANGSERLVREEESYKREDMIPLDSPNIVSLAEGYGAAEILSSIGSSGIK